MKKITFKLRKNHMMKIEKDIQDLQTNTPEQVEN